MVLALLSQLQLSSAQQPNPKQAAGAHFDRGVSLYSEGDFQAALTEFKRAYELFPNALVLYNLGQASFQIRDYASALKYFEQYLAEAGANPPHKAEVEQNLAVLRSRVGRLSVRSNLAAEVLIDSEPRGKTPLVGVLLSVGKHKLLVRPDDAPAQERTIEIAAGDDAEQSFSSPSPRTPRPPLVSGWLLVLSSSSGLTERC